jgi:hypothetical protein
MRVHVRVCGPFTSDDIIIMMRQPPADSVFTCTGGGRNPRHVSREQAMFRDIFQLATLVNRVLDSTRCVCVQGRTIAFGCLV